MDTKLTGDYIVYLYWGFAAISMIQLAYFWGVFSRLAFYRKKNTRHEKEPVSIVICARNEYLSLKKNLPQILEQEYPEYEVVVVNDSSDDDTEFLLKTFTEHYPRLSVVHFRENLNFFSGKKFPLALGIRSARFDNILLTDADCRPGSRYWLREMQDQFGGKTEIVLGYSRYDEKKGLFDKLLRFDAVTAAMKYFSWALSGMPYTGNGKNLAYRKSLFFRTGGFISHYRIRFGDDDLFVNRCASADNVTIQISPDSQTITTDRYDFSRWIKKKKRQLATIRHYKMKHKAILSLFSLTQFLFYLCFPLLVIMNYNLYVVLALFGIRMFSALLVFKRCMNKLGEYKLLLYLPFFEVFLVLLNPVLSLSASLVKQDKWK